MSTSEQLIEGMQGLTALVVGDVMLDAYLWGRVERISPEAPVPVVRVTERSGRLGGAANVALNVRALGATPVVLSVTGADDDGARLAELFKQSGLPENGLIASTRRQTTVKTRVISGHQHIVRVDDETDAELDDADAAALIARADELFAQRKPDVVILEDYDKGVLTERTIAALIALSKKHNVPVAVDPKKRNFFAYRGVDLFKPNLKELREGLKTEIKPGDRKSVKEAVLELERRLGNAASLITLSEHGVYAHAGKEEHTLKAHTREIADVSGAGDTVIAVAALCLAQRSGLRELAALSNLAGGLVCEHVGVAPIERDLLLAETHRLGSAL
ncbi:MAG: bifunctional ADP-heptose synthase [Flavobacteriales bacterium]